MPKNLLIVESPAKAKTIEKFLGGDFVVKSSYGHVRDLTKDSKDQKAIDVDNNYALTYVVSPDKKKVVQELKKLSKSVEEVWLATDEDREGEAISWHLAQVLNLDVVKTKRIVFREITKPALQKAVQQPRKVDMNVVNAQQARRVLDRLVGFELSGLLWRKVKSGLSAGRVQSVAVRLLVEREREIQQHVPEPYYKVNAFFDGADASGQAFSLRAEVPQKLNDEAAAQQLLDACKTAQFSIKEIKVRPTKRKPAAPFTTSTLQQDASRKLGFSVSRTMSAAQRLYEAGHITYMRTDSVRLSEVAVQEIVKVIAQQYGNRYVQTRQYKSKKANTQEAHEAIRPTYFSRLQAGADLDQQRLYELIWKRTVASQMAEAELKNTTVDIQASTAPDTRFVAKGQVLLFEGFLKVYLESTDEDEESDEVKGILPPLEKGQSLDLNQMEATERFTRHVPRYTEASLVKKLEELGIGRPSTYAPIISKIMEPSRGYITKETREGQERAYQIIRLKDKAITTREATEITGAEKNKLFASDTGKLVSDFLTEHFANVMDYSFTARVEDQLDEIAEGKEEWRAMIDSFYRPFHEHIEETLEKAARKTGERILGKDEETGRTILVRMSRNGAVAQIGAPDELGEDEKPQYAGLRPTQSIETVTLEEVKELFQFPKEIGTYEGKPVVLNIGRYGPYILFQEAFISLPKGMSPHEVSMEHAVDIISEHRKANEPIAYYKELPITKGVGRFGPYVKWNGMYASITKSSGFLLETLTAEQAIELVKLKEEKEANRIIQTFPEYKTTLEMGRWGPLIRVGRKKHNIPKNDEGRRLTREEALELTFEDVERILESMGAPLPKPKKKATKKKTTKAKTKKSEAKSKS